MQHMFQTQLTEEKRVAEACRAEYMEIKKASEDDLNKVISVDLGYTLHIIPRTFTGVITTGV